MRQDADTKCPACFELSVYGQAVGGRVELVCSEPFCAWGVVADTLEDAHRMWEGEMLAAERAAMEGEI